MSATTFDQLITPIRQDKQTYHWEVPDGWQQGRGAFGGLVMAALVRAMEMAVAEEAEMPLRTVTATLCGATTPGASTIEVAFLRLGSGTITVEARIVQDGELRTHVVGLFGKDREVGELANWNTLEAPEVTWHEEIPIARMQPPLAPVFTQHVNFQPITGFPYSGADTMEALGWVRMKHPGKDRGAAYIAAHADAWWPTAMTTIDTFRPMATVTYTLQLFEAFDTGNLDAPMIHSARSTSCQGGFFAETRELWGADGRLLAINQQTFCIIK